MGWKALGLILVTSGCVLPDSAEVVDADGVEADGTDSDDDCDTVKVYEDVDGDGFGDPATLREACAPAAGEVTSGGDCDDTDATVHPGADEYCDGVDEDCDGRVDNGALDAVAWYTDADKDGFGSSLFPMKSCSTIPGRTRAAGDCDDSDASIHPGAVDAPCDGIDSDCDGATGGGPVVVAGTDYSTIQTGLNAASVGGTVEVCPGTYAESLSISRDVTLRGVTGKAADVVIVPPSGRGLAAGATTITLSGLTFRGGTDGYNGGNALVHAVDLLVEDCAFEDGYAGYEGGGLDWMGDRLIRSSVTIRRTAFRDNVADYGGGGLSTAAWTGYDLTLEDVVFERNEAYYEGGGASLSTLERTTVNPVSMELDRVDFIDNYAEYEGGGLAIGGWRGNEVRITDSHFEGNEALNEGGGASIDGWSPTASTLTGTTFVNNASGSGAALDAGSWSDDTLVIEDCVFEDHAGGTWAVEVGGWGAADVTVNESRFSDNDGGLSIGGRGTAYSLVGSNNTFEDTALGAAVSVGGEVDLTGGVFRRNNGGIVARGDLSLSKVDLASGADDNVEFDVVSPGAATFYSGVTTLVCVGGVCTP